MWRAHRRAKKSRSGRALFLCVGGWPLRALRALERDEPMLTLCLPAAGIQEEEAVAIEGGGWDGGKKRITGQLNFTSTTVVVRTVHNNLFHCNGPFSNNRDTSKRYTLLCSPIYVVVGTGGPPNCPPMISLPISLRADLFLFLFPHSPFA
jgi:hypothetical protein